MSAVPKLRFPEFDGEWLETNIGSCGTFYYGKSAPKWSVSEDAPTPCIRYGELYTKFGATVDKIYSRTNIDPAKLRFSKGGEVLVPRVGEDPRDFAKCTMLPFSGVAIGEMISVFETDQNSLFFTYYFNTMKNQFAKMVAGGNPSNLYYENLKPLAIWRPSLPEQQKIASFLSSVDKKIDLLHQKKDALELYKKGLMQKIFSQEIRFKQEDGSDFPDWEEVALNEIAKRSTEKNKDLELTLVLTNSATQGVVIQTEYFDKSIANEANISGYYKVRKSDFVYNPRISSAAPVGPVSQNLRGDGVMSPLYTVFRVDDQYQNFLGVYFKTSVWFDYMRSVANQGARHDRMNITTGDFMALPIDLPCARERQKIASFLAAIDAKIQNASSQVEQMETYKKGLLQQMFV